MQSRTHSSFYPSGDWLFEGLPPAYDEIHHARARGRNRLAGRRLRILLVESDFVIALGTNLMLSKIGHRLVQVSAGPKALEVLRDGFRADLLITDFGLPQMNGVELAGRARLIQPSLSILLATGYMTMPDGGVFPLPHLPKPYDEDELIEKIESLLTVN